MFAPVSTIYNGKLRPNDFYMAHERRSVSGTGEGEREGEREREEEGGREAGRDRGRETERAVSGALTH